MNLQILNRESIPPGARTWEQIEVAGEHPAMLGNERVVQVIDEAAMLSMVKERLADMRSPDGEMLVDKDHLSHLQNHDTEAMAWLSDIEIRDGQLWGNLDWTDVGAAAVRNKRLRYFSTEYDAGDLEDLGIGPDGVRRVRPLRLAGLALTNRPNNKGGRAIANRSQTSKAGDAEHNPTQETKSMKSIAEKLGLPAEATEEEILAKIDALQGAAAKAAEMEAEVKAEEILNREVARIPEGQRDAWKKELIANREGAGRLIMTLPKVEGASPGRPAITNRATAAVPSADRAHGELGDTAAKQKAKVQIIQNRERCDFARAWEIARAEHPDLF